MSNFGKFNAGVKSGLKAGKFGNLKDVSVINSYDYGILRYDLEKECWDACPGPAKVQGDFYVTGTVRYLGDLYVTGTAYLQNTVVKHRTNLDAEGSSKFGDDITDTHQFSGSIYCNTAISSSISTETNTLLANYLNIKQTTTFNEVEYSWPSADGAVNQVLTTDGSGSVAWRTVGTNDDDFTSNGDEWQSDRTIGNITDYYLGVITNDVQRIHVAGAGQGGFVGVGVSGSSVTHRLTLPNTSTDNSGSCRAHKFATYSSRRYKKNIQTIPDPINKMLRMRGVFFEWKDSDKKDVGFIAEEVGAVLPQIVDFEPNGVDAESMEYGKVGAVLLECAKEQQRMIKGLDLAIIRDNEEHKEKEAQLQAQIDVLAAEIEYLKLSWWAKIKLWYEKKFKNPNFDN